MEKRSLRVVQVNFYSMTHRFPRIVELESEDMLPTDPTLC
jgi:hypothetical protein